MKKAMAVVAFGTTYSQTYEKCIAPLIKGAQERYPDLEVKEGFTSRIIQRLLRKRGIHIQLEEEVVNDLVQDDFEIIYIQPLHLLTGHEYNKLKLDQTVLGDPLFANQDDIRRFADVMAFEADEGEVYLLMGHGTDHQADWIYQALEEEYRKRGQRVVIATLEGSRLLEDVQGELRRLEAKKVILQPLMLVAGDHAENDMASDDPDSWKSYLEGQGYEVEVVMKGLGEYSQVRDLFYEKMDKLVDRH